MPRAGRTRGQSHRRHHRQPECEEHRKRGGHTDPPGYDAGKKIKGRKRHILVDTQGLLMAALVHSAGLHDRDGGVLLMGQLFGLYPFLKRLFVDSGYAGKPFAAELAKLCPSIKITVVKRPKNTKGFKVLPKRWIVERSIAWLNRCRRLAKDWENLSSNALAFLLLASIRLMVRKICNH